jgi:hydrogenase maturation protein HypF
MKQTKIKLPFRIKRPVLAFGPQTKNTICFAEGDLAYISSTHQNLSDPVDLSSFEKSVKYFLKKHPKIIAYDLHPEYQSTKYALSLADSYVLCPVQHHHAHIASCMAECGLKNQRVIGVAFDGTGLGSDNHLWGAEFLVCDYKDFRRRAHLKEVPLLGGEKAILEPARVAAAWLCNSGIDPVKIIDNKKWVVLKKMYLSGFNSPLASSMGRLFDAAGSLILGKGKVSFEAELAIELEKLALSSQSIARGYKFNVVQKNNSYILDPLPMFREIITALKANEKKKDIAYSFHLAAAQMIRKTCLILRGEEKINKVVLSGGVFQNNLLLKLALDLLYKEGFSVFTHKTLSCNDSCVSLGQAAVANFRS